MSDTPFAKSRLARVDQLRGQLERGAARAAVREAKKPRPPELLTVGRSVLLCALEALESLPVRALGAQQQAAVEILRRELGAPP